MDPYLERIPFVHCRWPSFWTVWETRAPGERMRNPMGPVLGLVRIRSPPPVTMATVHNQHSGL